MPAILGHPRVVHQAFILGAGLGTRLRPLTNHLPKPMVPLFHRPLVEWALDACAQVGITRFAINTHHAPDAWQALGEPASCHHPHHRGGNGLDSQCRTWHHHEISLFHEPILLETGGGLKNIESWIDDQPLLVHNGDIFSSLPLAQLLAAHQASGLPATLALRSESAEKRVSIDATGTRVTDLRSQLLNRPGSHGFTGIYCINRELLADLPRNQNIQIIPAFLALAQQGRLGAIILDEGEWFDLGDRASYLHAHRTLNLAPPIHPQATIHPTAEIHQSIIGPGAIIGANAVVRNSVVWPSAVITAGACLDRCIARHGNAITGNHIDADL